MSVLDTRPALEATVPGVLAELSIALLRTAVSARSPSASGHATRIWFMYQAWWLNRRLRRIESELRELATPAADGTSESCSPISGEHMATYESCRVERALVHARIARCRALA